jgi:hypothetical protein
MDRKPGGDQLRPSHRGSTPLAGARLATATQFLRQHALPAHYLDGIDFSSDVRVVILNPGFHLIAFHAGPLPGAGSWNPFGLFYTEVGVSPYEIAIKPDTRIFTRYIVVKAVRALRSRAAPTARTTGRGPRYLLGGRGWQYLIPAARNSLRPI